MGTMIVYSVWVLCVGTLCGYSVWVLCEELSMWVSCVEFCLMFLQASYKALSKPYSFENSMKIYATFTDLIILICQ